MLAGLARYVAALSRSVGARWARLAQQRLAPSSRTFVRLLLVCALCAAVWWLIGDKPAVPVATLDAPRATAATVVAALAEPVAPRRAASVSPGASDAPRTHTEDEVEVCGAGWVPVPANGIPDEKELLAARGVEQARDRLMTAMRTSADAHARAMAMWMDTLLDVPRSAEHRDALARTAAISADPRIYGLAFRTCQVRPQEGACALLNAQQWARLDEGNGAPWLHLLDLAGSRGDDAARDEALFRLSAAARFEDRYFDAASSIVAHAADSDVDALAARSLVVDAIGMVAAQTVPMMPLVRSCRGPALADTNRGQVCAAIARGLVDHADTLLMRGMGATLDNAVTGDSTVRDQVRAETSAWMRLLAPSFRDFDCSQLRRNLGYFSRAAQVGEVRALRERAAAESLARSASVPR